MAESAEQQQPLVSTHAASVVGENRHYYKRYDTNTIFVVYRNLR